MAVLGPQSQVWVSGMQRSPSFQAAPSLYKRGKWNTEDGRGKNSSINSITSEWQSWDLTPEFLTAYPSPSRRLPMAVYHLAGFFIRWGLAMSLCLQGTSNCRVWGAGRGLGDHLARFPLGSDQEFKAQIRQVTDDPKSPVGSQNLLTPNFRVHFSNS